MQRSKLSAWKVGDVSIDRVVEVETTGGTRFLLPDATREAVLPMDWLRPDFADDDGNLVMCIHSYVLKTPGQTILIDTGIGNDKQRPIPLWHERSGTYLDGLAAMGVTAESVDLVICTHLHVDHVGWNTMLVDGQWTPTFPNARYRFGRVEWEYWSAQHDQQFGTPIDDSVRPIVDAGLADLFEMDEQLTNEVRAEPTPGHSIGHTSLWIESAEVVCLQFRSEFLGKREIRHAGRKRRIPLEWAGQFRVLALLLCSGHSQVFSAECD